VALGTVALVVSDGKHWTIVKLEGGRLSGHWRRSSARGRWHSTAPALEAERGCGAASSGGGGEVPVGDRDMRKRDDVRCRQDRLMRRTCAAVLLTGDKGNVVACSGGRDSVARLATWRGWRSVTAVTAWGQKVPTVRGSGCRLWR
jgi:hypothetical protein